MLLKALLPLLGIAGVGYYSYKKQDDEGKKADAEEANFLRDHPEFEPADLKDGSGEK